MPGSSTAFELETSHVANRSSYYAIYEEYIITPMTMALGEILSEKGLANTFRANKLKDDR